MPVWRFTRRAALLLPVLLAACGGDPESDRASKASLPPLRYEYLPPIRLTVKTLEMDDGAVPPTGADSGDASPVNLTETIYAMARDRLKPAGSGGRATLHIARASLVRRGDTLNGTLAVRLDVRNAEETSTGFTEAHVTASQTAPNRDPRKLAYEMLKSMMDDLNVELEYQIRHQLRAWVIENEAVPPPAPAAPTKPGTELPLPPPPPPPPLRS